MRFLSFDLISLVAKRRSKTSHLIIIVYKTKILKLKGGEELEFDFIMKAVGIGMTVAISCLILSRCGREDQSSLIALCGVIALLLLFFSEIGQLYDAVRTVFGI